MVSSGSFVLELSESWRCALAASAEGLSLASVLRETPRRDWISSLRKPFDSRKDILWSVEASRMDSSSRNLDARSRRAERSEEASSELGGGLADWFVVASVLCCCCHAGMDEFFFESDMMSEIRI